MASRKLEDLSPVMQAMVRQMLARAATGGVELLVTCTYRSNAEQALLYAKGRTLPGYVVTHARPGQSPHNTVDAGGKPAAEAVDVVPLVGGKAIWNDDDPVWPNVGEIGKSCGLEWGGDWSERKRDKPHFENPAWVVPT